NNYYILEAKNINDSGGVQNSSVDELISVIELNEKNEKIHYISFMDGRTTNDLLVSNLLRKNKDELKILKKIKTRKEMQRRDIIKNLKKYDKNYFLNTEGFKKFIDDLIKR
ncbi:MAG: hypothetical protein ABIJ83_03605, partial [Patescibacteria group bacterium]